MKLLVKLLLTGVAAFGAGFAAGYFVRKKACEVEIEEISEEELQKLTQQMEEKQEEASNDIFDVPETTPISNDEKEAYFRLWKESNAEQYDTRAKEPPDDVVTTEDVDGIEEYLSHLEDIEPGTMADWMEWMSKPDGEYDTVELFWYDRDNVVCDEEGDPLLDSEKFMGFDIKEEFYLADEESTGDPDIRVIFNHKTKTIYHITRTNSSYAEIKRMEEFGRDGYDDEDE